MNRCDKKSPLRADDVFLVSYPRSGNTWLRYLIANLMHPGSEWNIENLNLAVPDLHQELPDGYMESQPRIFKSHSAYCKDYSRLIYMCRDGRDVSVSYYDLRKKKGLYKKGYPEFLLEMLQGKMPYGSWQEHINSWLFPPHNIPLLVITYEQLHADTAGTMKLAGDFMGLQWSEAEIETAIHKSTFQKQQRDLYLYKHESHWVKGYHGGVKGSPGKWREVFDEHLNELFWKHAGEVSEKLGYSK
ncbi:MAG: sulfotransferase domain-containing protein [bacterium]|nr:sulfotransferase domain-containing protein [bacterium]